MKKVKTPTLVVSGKEFRELKYGLSQLVISARRAVKVVPPTAQEIGENQVVFPDASKTMNFRRRFTRQTCTRNVRFITADNSDRFNVRFYINFKEL